MTLPSSLTRIARDPFLLLDSDGHKSDSMIACRYRAIKLVIANMRERFHEPLKLQELANIAQFSPFYFNRVFRSLTGVAPTVFLASLRIERAKQLLLTTNRSVTEVCFDVGYNSLGTFTHRFNMFVGTSPSRFRLFAQDQMMSVRSSELRRLLQDLHLCDLEEDSNGIHGSVQSAIPFQGLIFVGAFPDSLPQGQPLSCSILTAPGFFSLPPLRDGTYYIFAAAMDASQNLRDFLSTGTNLRGGSGKHPLYIQNGVASHGPEMMLSHASWIDPPMLISLPWLLVSRLIQTKEAIP